MALARISRSIAVSACLCEKRLVGHLHLSKPNSVCGFRAKSVARVKALPYLDEVRRA